MFDDVYVPSEEIACASEQRDEKKRPVKVCFSNYTPEAADRVSPGQYMDMLPLLQNSMEEGFELACSCILEVGHELSYDFSTANILRTLKDKLKQTKNLIP